MPIVRAVGKETWHVLEEPVTALRAVRGYVLTEHHNAWYGSLSSKYRGPAALHIQKSDAATMAEKWRRQGTYFLIREVPSLRFITDAGSLIITDFHSTEPFKECSYWAGGTSALTPGRSLITALSPIWSIEHGTFGSGWWWDSLRPSEHSIITGVIDPDVRTTPAGRGALTTWQSIPMGTGWRLGWMGSKNDYTQSSVHRIARRFRENGKRERR